VNMGKVVAFSISAYAAREGWMQFRAFGEEAWSTVLVLGVLALFFFAVGSAEV